jgi:hypothetical protein
MMDADSYINKDLTHFLSDLVGRADISLPFSRGYASLAPWKRYIANSIYVKRTPEVFDLFQTLNSYIVYGLSEPLSWMLDQNAITYALEVHRGVKVVDLNQFERVTSRPMVFSIFEKNVRQGKGEHRLAEAIQSIGDEGPTVGLRK